MARAVLLPLYQRLLHQGYEFMDRAVKLVELSAVEGADQDRCSLRVDSFLVQLAAEVVAAQQGIEDLVLALAAAATHRPIFAPTATATGRT